MALHPTWQPDVTRKGTLKKRCLLGRELQPSMVSSLLGRVILLSDTRQGGLMQVIIPRDEFINRDTCVPIGETYLFRDVSRVTHRKNVSSSEDARCNAPTGLGMWRAFFTVGRALPLVL